jgi:hypothetical protein
MTPNEIHYKPTTSTHFSVVCLASKSPCSQNMLLHIESTRRHTHRKQVEVVYHYTEKESWRQQNQNFCVYHIVYLSACHCSHPNIEHICQNPWFPPFEVHLDTSSEHNCENHDCRPTGHHRYILMHCRRTQLFLCYYPATVSKQTQPIMNIRISLPKQEHS